MLGRRSFSLGLRSGEEEVCAERLSSRKSHTRPKAANAIAATDKNLRTFAPFADYG
jgi:hypothetical protein